MKFNDLAKNHLPRTGLEGLASAQDASASLPPGSNIRKPKLNTQHFLSLARGAFAFTRGVHAPLLAWRRVESLRLADGATLRYDERPGRDPAILLAHGVLDDASLWAGVADRLAAAGRRVLLPHSRGHGASEPWRAGMDWSPRAEAADLTELLRRAAPEGAHLVGHSRGATALSWIAVEEPDFARSLALVASPPQASEAFRARFRDRLARARDPREAEALRYLSSIPDDDFPAESLRRWRGRALVVEAGRDPLYGPTSTLFWRAFLPFAEFERLDDAGHDVPRERPGWLADRLLRFVAAAEGA